jgi:ubiquinone/menaquinone biosynthesis C-methylase UbiE
MHKFDPENAARLERHERYTLIPPDATLRRLGVRNGMVVVDIGAGTGYFARAAAELVGPAGHVYAVDMAQAMLDNMRSHALPDNVDLVLSGEYFIPLPTRCADLTLLAFVVHETPDVLRLIREAARVTRPDGRILIIEWKQQVEDSGPLAEERLDQRELHRRIAGHFVVHEQGHLNPSHYYSVLSVAHAETQGDSSCEIPQ